jgi:acyl-CoA reductase-like NAD-dependent aldehyde dehydrogenase
LDRANATSYGLGGSVFSKKHGVDIARRMRSGMTSINAMAAFAFVPALPFGGVGSSGFGRIHGADGLREFTRPKSITRQRWPLPTPLTTFHRKHRDLNLVVKAVTAIHGRRGKLG